MKNEYVPALDVRMENSRAQYLSMRGSQEHPEKDRKTMTMSVMSWLKRRVRYELLKHILKKSIFDRIVSWRFSS